MRVAVFAVLVATLFNVIPTMSSPTARAAEWIFGENVDWQYWRTDREPADAWAYSTNNLGWKVGRAPLGFGSTAVKTTLPAYPAAGSTYFRRIVNLSTGATALTQGAQFTTVADDGVIVFVNGREVGRKRVDNTGAAMFSTTRANAAVSTSTAFAAPVRFNIPASYFKAGRNVISVQVLANWLTSPNISFKGYMTAGGGGTAPTVVRPNSGMSLVWSDEFNGTSLNTANWKPANLMHYGDDHGQLECQTTRPQNMTMRDGKLVMTARKESTPIKCGTDDYKYPNGRSYTGAYMTSQGKVSMLYGRIEMRAKAPVVQNASTGIWPAFWMRPNDAGKGEIDILEAIGTSPGDDHWSSVVQQSAHSDYSGTKRTVYSYKLPQGGTLDGQFHTYAVEWSSTKVSWFVDGVLTHSISASTTPWFNEAFVGRPFHIRLNLAVGGSWPGNPDGYTRFPAEYQIDYVRIYK